MKTNYKNTMIKAVLAVMVCSMSIGAYAQSSSAKPGYQTNGFWDNWFISAGVGANSYLGGMNPANTLGKRITPVYDISLGKWITPAIGVRLQWNGSYMKEYGPFNSAPYNSAPFRKGATMSKFGYNGLHGDILWNLSAAIGGFKADRVYEVIPFGGVGYAQAFDQNNIKNRDTELALSFGVINKFRVSKSFDVNLEIRNSLVASCLDGVDRGNKFDNILAATVGVTWNIGKNTFTRSLTMDSPEIKSMEADFQSQLKSLEANLAAAKNNNKKLAEEVDQLKNRKVEQTVNVVETKVVISPISIFFEFAKYNLSAREKINIEQLAKTMKAYPNSKYTLYGHADMTTGPKAYNNKLSQQRAEAVKAELIKNGAKADQLTIVVDNSKSPYKTAAFNRVVIVESK